MKISTTISGQTIELDHTGAQFVWASAYRQAGSDRLMIKVHRSEKVASKGQWDSPAMREVWAYAGYAAIVRAEA